MSDDPNELLDEGGKPVLDKNIREHIRKTERENAELREFVQASKLRDVFDELGIAKDGAGKLFRDTYRGDATVDAVRAVAGGYGTAILATGSATPEELERQANLEALQRINGSTDPGASREASDILTTTLARLREASKKGDLEAFDAIMDSPEVQALRDQPISFV